MNVATLTHRERHLKSQVGEPQPQCHSLGGRTTLCVVTLVVKTEEHQLLFLGRGIIAIVNSDFGEFLLFHLGGKHG